MKMKRFLSIVLTLCMVLSLLPVGVLATTEQYVEFTVDSLGLVYQSYSTGTNNIDGVGVEWIQLGNYGDGIQMRDRDDGRTSMLWNTSALGNGITKIELTYSATKNVTYSNPDAVIFTFGNTAKGASYSTKLSTEAGVKTYTVTPNASTYTYFYIEHDLQYSMYWDSIKVYYNGNQGGNTQEPVTPHAASAIEVIDAPVVGTAYKFGMVQENVSSTDVYYLTGEMKGYYMDTTTDPSAAIDVYLEQTSGGYYLYTIKGSAKTYINMVVSGTHVNGAYESSASTVYRYDEESKTLIADVNGKDYWFGTRNDKTYTTVGPCATSYNGFYCCLTPPDACTHKYVAEVIMAATCTADGVRTYTCSICSDSYTESIEALGHSWVNATCTLCGAVCAHEYVAEVYPASCTEGGFTLFTCSLCGDSYIGDEVAAYGHPEIIDGFCTFCGKYEEPQLSEKIYEIYNAGQLYWFAEQVNSGNTSINGKLMADIVVNENVLNEDGTLNGDGSNFRVWTPIGNYSRQYLGTFDGNGKTVSGLYFNDGNKNYVGMFGSVYYGNIQNVGVVDSYLSGKYHVGGVVGATDYGTVSNSYNTGIVSGYSYVGGVVGETYYGTVSNCCNTGSVSGSGSRVGGVVGCNNNGPFSDCYNTGTVSNCYNTGSVSGDEYVGGVVGCNYSTVSDCYFDSTVDSGSAVGDNRYGTVINVVGKTTAQFTSGEVAYLLQGEQTEQIWGQEIGVDPSPVLGGEPVYFINGEYSNKVCQHEYQAVVTQPTCTAGGYTTYTCTGCGESYTGNATNPTGHSWTAANCKNPKTCSACGITEGDLGDHSYTAQITAPGCLTDGFTTHTCTGCGDSYRDSYVLASGHSWVDADCTQPITCTTCGQTWGQPMGHSFGEVTVHKPTPDAQGYSEHSCTICGFAEQFDFVEFRGVTLSGQLTSSLEGDATVELVQDGEVVYSTIATGGSYAIEGVVAGDYTLRVTKANHISVEIAITVGNEAVTQDATICPIGDVTGDGSVNIKDFQRLLRHVNKTNPLEDYELACGDVTGDGVCNIKDFQRLLRHVNKTNPLF